MFTTVARSPPSYTALGWQDQKTKNYIGFFLWGNYKTRRKTKSKAKLEPTEVAEGTEGKGFPGLSAPVGALRENLRRPQDK
jgi:hypothetical protein